MLTVRDGDLDKLGVLFDRHHKLLFNFFLRLTSSREASEDLVQEVFFRMLKYRHSYRGSSQFSFWMFQIARNARIDYFRKKREVNCGEDLDTLADEDLLVSDHLERDEDSRLLHLALNKKGYKDSSFKVKKLHEQDLSKGYGETYLPNALARKWRNAARELAWQYVFPAKNLSEDPRSGVIRRHHVLESGLQKAVKTAVR